MMNPSIAVVCQNPGDERIIPRMARALRDRNGWTLVDRVDKAGGADAIYLSAYFEGQRGTWPRVPVAAYFSHREEKPPGNGKAKLFDKRAGEVALRVATCALYAQMLVEYGDTIVAAAPLERERFTPPPAPPARGRGARAVVGFSGYTYANKRKGEDLARGLVESRMGQQVEWRASGRGWPVPTRAYSWLEMPDFYRSLDLLVVPSRVEGIPMPPLEALACGIPVVVPRGVGLLDELPETPGIWRYERGNVTNLIETLGVALDGLATVEPEALREATAPYSVEQWCRDVALGMEMLTDKAHGAAVALAGDRVDGGIEESGDRSEETAGDREEIAEVRKAVVAPVERGTGSDRGIYCVAFGEPSRWCARRLVTSIKRHMPQIPVCLCAASPLGLEDVFVKQPDSDVGGRRAKLKAYELSPAEWKAVLYLDADTEVVGPDIVRYFEWVEAGWEFVICKDPHLMDTMHSFERRNNREELEKVRKAVGLDTLQFNGGVWAFGRGERVAAFFRRWQEEWEIYAQRDQGALVRALYADPLRMLVLGNEWNTFPKYSRGVQTAGLMHYPGDARRWHGMIPGRIDSAEAWAMVESYERTWKAKKHG
jgi:hypothetical protein